MILLIMGLLDIVAGVELVLLKWGLFVNFGLFLGLYLIVKGLIFLKSIPSIIDVICGIVIVLMVFGFSVPLFWLASIWLVQKGVVSLISS